MGNTPLETIVQLLRVTPQAQILLEGDSILAASPEAQRLFPNLLSGFTANQLFGLELQAHPDFQQEGSFLFSATILENRYDVAVMPFPPYRLCTVTPTGSVENGETILSASQQLRESLTSVFSVFQRLLPTLEQLDAPDALSQAGEVTRGLYQLLRTTQNLSQFATAQPSLQRVQFDLCTYFRTLEEQLHALCRLTGWNLEFHYPSEPCLCSADQTLLTQAIMNLLSNAFRFSQPGQPIILTCRKQKGRLFISIQDHGQGIPPDQMGTVFFRSAHRGQLPDPRWGAGLGLQAADGSSRPTAAV